MSLLKRKSDTSWILPKGRISRRTLNSNSDLEYVVYCPRSVKEDTQLFVSIHGLSRNSHEQARVFSRFCEIYNVVMLVPVFSKEEHADYQRLGRNGLGKRADHFLNDCIAQVSLLANLMTDQFYLFGYSGGAQFAHRYVMAYPHRIVRAVIAGAGWYTFPDTRLKYPYGIRVSRKLADTSFNPEEFLQVPVTVLAGERDTSNNALRRSPRIDEQQGENRVQRARKWVATMRAAAEIYGLQPLVTYSEVPGVDHSFAQFVRHGALAERVFYYLFDTPGKRTSKTNRAVSGGSKPV